MDGVSPTGTKAERVKPVRKNKLASMFNNAWEQGNLAEQVSWGGMGMKLSCRLTLAREGYSSGCQ